MKYLGLMLKESMMVAMMACQMVDVKALSSVEMMVVYLESQWVALTV